MFKVQSLRGDHWALRVGGGGPRRRLKSVKDMDLSGKDSTFYASILDTTKT